MVRGTFAVVIAAMGVALVSPALAAPQGTRSADGVRPQATPVGNPASWFPADAYPPAAKAAGAEGRTAFLIDVDARGRVTGCNVTTSSGSPLLDSTTCNLLVVNGRFHPAHDASGQPVAGIWASAMVWRLTTSAPGPEPIQDSTGPSPAEIYNNYVSGQAKAEAAERGDDQDQDQNQAQSQAPDPGQGMGMNPGQ